MAAAAAEQDEKRDRSRTRSRAARGGYVALGMLCEAPRDTLDLTDDDDDGMQLFALRKSLALGRDRPRTATGGGNDDCTVSRDRGQTHPQTSAGCGVSPRYLTGQTLHDATVLGSYGGAHHALVVV
jgi:hypothetical protein